MFVFFRQGACLIFVLLFGCLLFVFLCRCCFVVCLWVVVGLFLWFWFLWLLWSLWSFSLPSLFFVLPASLFLVVVCFLCATSTLTFVIVVCKLTAIDV